MRRAVSVVICACAAASTALAQTAQSPNFALASCDLNAGGGGACSAGFVGWTCLGETSSDLLASPAFRAGIGALHGDDFTPASDAPLVFSIAPAFGPKAGGTAVV